jgi:hypothetical protein
LANSGKSIRVLSIATRHDSDSQNDARSQSNSPHTQSPSEARQNATSRRSSQGETAAIFHRAVAACTMWQDGEPAERAIAGCSSEGITYFV